MSKVRINDLARELEVKSRPILDALEAIGVSGKTHSSSIEDDQAEKVRAYFAGDRSHATVRSSGPGAPKPKFDLSQVSKPGDAMRAILERKNAENAARNAPPVPAPRPVNVAPPVRPVPVAPVAVARPVVAAPPAAAPAVVRPPVTVVAPAPRPPVAVAPPAPPVAVPAPAASMPPVPASVPAPAAAVPAPAPAAPSAPAVNVPAPVAPPAPVSTAPGSATCRSPAQPGCAHCGPAATCGRHQ